MIEIELQIPQKISSNKIYAGMHWRARSEVVDLYHMAMLEIRNHKIKIEKFPVTIEYNFYFTGTALDTLNCAFMAKMIEDAIVRAGALPDDTPKYVSKSILTSQKSKKFKTDTVIIKIT